MSLVELTKDNEIAIITVNNPPVNALSPGVPEGISECIDKVYKDDSVKPPLSLAAAAPSSLVRTSRSLARSPRARPSAALLFFPC